MPTQIYHIGGTEGQPAQRWNPKGTGLPPNIGDAWTDAELSKAGLAKALDPDPVPGGKTATGKAVLTISGVPQWAYTLEDTTVASGEVNTERDRRTEMGLTVNIGGTDRTFQFDEKSRENISGAATLAGFAIGAGAQPGDYLWHGGATPFSWILSDNSVIQIDAPTMFAIGQAAANRVSRFVFAARAVKESKPIPLDYTDSKHWP